MVNDLKQLLHDNVAAPPHDDLDLAGLVSRGRSRVRRRHAAVVAGTAAAVLLAGGSWAVGGHVVGADGPGPADRRLEPVGPVVHPQDAVPGTRGEDWKVLMSYTNRDLDAGNGQHLDGLTDDGLVALRDGPHGIANRTRLVLVDPATREQDSLPPPPGQLDAPLELSRDRIVYAETQSLTRPRVSVLDRQSLQWHEVSWPGLPRREFGSLQVADGRVYVGFDRGGSYQRFDLWSASLTDPSDVRDEHLVVGDFEVTGHELTWTSTHNAPNDGLHVRDLATGEQDDVDPRSGDRCNQLSLQRTASYVVLGQYCGTHDHVRDDRVQVVALDGSPVVTVQGDGIEPGAVSDKGAVVTRYPTRQDPDGATYVYSFADGRLRQVADSMSRFSLPWLDAHDPAVVMWHTAVNHRHGSTQWVARLP